jgi:voltage-gated potassium channel
MNEPGAATDTGDARQQLAEERESLLQQLHERLEAPMLVLSFVWLALFVIEMIRGLTPLLEDIGYVIWALFLLEFAVGFILAPQKLPYLRQNWLKAIALVAPALRIFRIVAVARLLRFARVARGLRMLRLVSSLNRGMAALGASLGRRGFAYVMLLSFIVLLAGAGGIYGFEHGAVPQGGIDNYGTALWWTAMILTTMGSDYWPKTAEGRILCVILALYSFTMFGYVTATLATYFVGRDAADKDAPIAGQDAIDALREEVARLREDVRALAPARSTGDDGERNPR